MEKTSDLQKNFTVENRGDVPSDGSKATKKSTEAAKMCPTAKSPPKIDTPPGYISHRINLFEKLKEEYDDEVASKHRKTIRVDLPDYDRSIAETSWETTPVNIARYLGGQSLLEKIVIARVDGKLWDLDRPLESSCSLEFLKFDTPEGKTTFWKSSAHVLGQAAELKYGCLLCLGTVTDDGFFYEVGPNSSDGSKVPINAGDKESLEGIAEQIIAAHQKFERLVMSKENLLEMFKHNKYKVHLISSKIKDGLSATVYRCGPFIDLCSGPHMRHTGKIGVFEIEEKFPPGALWHAEADSVRRIYGISIPKKVLLEDRNKVKLEDLEGFLKRDSEENQGDAELTKEAIVNLGLLSKNF